MMIDIEKIARDTKPVFSSIKRMNEAKDNYYYPMSPEWLSYFTNEVIEMCAIACESIKEQDYCVDVRQGADAIRNLKVKG